MVATILAAVVVTLTIMADTVAAAKVVAVATVDAVAAVIVLGMGPGWLRS